MFGENSSGRVVSLLNLGPTPTMLRASTSNSVQDHASVSSRPIIKLPPLVPSASYRTTYRQRPRSISPESSPSSTPPLVRHSSISSQSESTASPMTPSYTHDHFDPQNKSAHYQAQSRYHAQMYQTTAQSQRAFATTHYLPAIEMSNGETSNGVGALNQHALHNLQPPLAYPDPEPPMAVLTSTTDLQPTQHYLDSNPTNATASTAPSQPQQPPREKPTSQSAGTQTSSAPSPTASAASLPSKKKFPCPHANRYDCSDTFTTSGHASRHGKKHTGEKSVVCPTCNKAFTRKDNMKQHERTHKNAGAKSGRGASAATSPTITTRSENSFTDAAQPKGRGRRNSGRSEEEDGDCDSPGLDALAVAANMR
ncbi:MAG: hypothetical protein Q9170_005532 [Blastenia crenularia]